MCANETNSWQPVPDRIDALLYWLRPFRGQLKPADGRNYSDSFQVPCNIILKRTTPRLWLPTLTIAWGIVATLLGVVQSRTGFWIARFFLGVTESGLFPGVVFYFSMWYKRRERQYRISLFFSAASLAGAFGGILAYVGDPLPSVATLTYTGNWKNGWRGVGEWLAVDLYSCMTRIPSSSSALIGSRKELQQSLWLWQRFGSSRTIRVPPDF